MKLADFENEIANKISSLNSMKIEPYKNEYKLSKIEEISEYTLKLIGFYRGLSLKVWNNKFEEHKLKTIKDFEDNFSEIRRLDTEIKNLSSQLNSKNKLRIIPKIKSLQKERSDKYHHGFSSYKKLDSILKPINDDLQSSKEKLETIFEKIKNNTFEIKLYSFCIALIMAFISFLFENSIIASLDNQMKWNDIMGFLLNFIVGIFTYEVAKNQIENRILNKGIEKSELILNEQYKLYKSRNDNMKNLAEFKM